MKVRRPKGAKLGKRKWIKGAIKKPGSLTAQAKRAGKTVANFCATLGPGASTRTKRRCNLRKTLIGFKKG